MPIVLACRRPVAAAIAVLSALGLAAAPAGARTHHSRRCAGAGTPAIAASRAEVKRAVVCLVNLERTSRGLPPLREDRRLDRSAQGWTRTMVSTHQFDHGGNFAARISDAGLHWSAAGENIATGFSTPRSVVDAWMGSVGHCRNILSPQYSRIGVGVVTRHVNHYASGGATWTQDFALPMGARAPSRNAGPMDRCPY
jgi:uncharacterized protein YkwD